MNFEQFELIAIFEQMGIPGCKRSGQCMYEAWRNLKVAFELVIGAWSDGTFGVGITIRYAGISIICRLAVKRTSN